MVVPGFAELGVSAGLGVTYAAHPLPCDPGRGLPWPYHAPCPALRSLAAGGTPLGLGVTGVVPGWGKGEEAEALLMVSLPGGP